MFNSEVLTHVIGENEASTCECEKSPDFLDHFLPFTLDNATLKTECIQKSKLKASVVCTMSFTYIFLNALLLM